MGRARPGALDAMARTKGRQLQIFDDLESNVRSYCRSWPTVFVRSHGSTLVDRDGREYTDFFAGAGALNYGHNHPVLKERLIRYLESDGVVHSLDMATAAKAELLETIDEVLLRPRELDFRVQFPGPTGTNAVEAALKLARKATGREGVIGFTNAFHGMTLGSLAVTGNSMKRRGAGVPLTNAATMPYDGFLGDGVDSIGILRRFLEDKGSGVGLPAAVILETVQAEGGINVASVEWLRGLVDLCHEHGVLVVVDEIQVGCGRTGAFFSFEEAGVEPDIVCLSKSVSGYGLPMSLVLFHRRYDVWEPGEHNGTFRGNNPAFVTASEALRTWWTNGRLTDEVARKAVLMRQGLVAIGDKHPGLFGDVRGRGMLQGLPCLVPETSALVTAAAFDLGLVVETAGPEDEVVKLLPPLVIDDAQLRHGLDLLAEAVNRVVDRAGAELLAASAAAQEVAS
jgi:diaminobutyrate-2-oxoglutarate transaminase